MFVFQILLHHLEAVDLFLLDVQNTRDSVLGIVIVSDQEDIGGVFVVQESYQLYLFLLIYHHINQLMWFILNVVGDNGEGALAGKKQSFPIILKLVSKAHELSLRKAHKKYGLVQGVLKCFYQFALRLAHSSNLTFPIVASFKHKLFETLLLCEQPVSLGIQGHVDIVVGLVCCTAEFIAHSFIYLNYYIFHLIRLI